MLKAFKLLARALRRGLCPTPTPCLTPAAPRRGAAGWFRLAAVILGPLAVAMPAQAQPPWAGPFEAAPKLPFFPFVSPYQLDPHLYIVSRGFTLIDDNTLLFVSHSDDTTLPVIPPDNIIITGAGIAGPGSITTWGWRLINPASKPSNALGVPVYDAARQRVYYRNKNNDLSMYIKSGATWVYGVSVLGATSKMTTNPTLEPTTGRLYYRGANGFMWIGDWSTSVTTPTLLATIPGTGTIAGEPVYDRYAGGGVFYRDTANKLRRAAWTGSWTVIACGNDTLGSDPALNAAQSVVYRDSFNRISSTWFSGSWNWSVWNPATNVTGKPSVGQPFGVVYYKGSDNRLWQSSWDSFQSKFVSMQTTPKPNVADSIVVNSQGKVYYRGTDSSLWTP